MNRQDIYRLLETKLLECADYADIPVQPVAQTMVPIPSEAHLTFRQIGEDMKAYTGDTVYVRSGVLKRLKRAAAQLAAHDKDLQLEVVYGYRALEIQRKLFETFKMDLAGEYTGEALLAAVERLVATPEVAGHPAGAAVDIQIIKGGKPLDFGTKIWEFVPDTYVFSPFISKQAWYNRQLLRRVMMREGFAPFDGEWWHFCYGDKEWAGYYGEPAAFYEQLEFTDTHN